MVNSTEPPTTTYHSDVKSRNVPFPMSPKRPSPSMSVPRSKCTSAVMKPRFTNCTRKTMYITFRLRDVMVFGRCMSTRRTMITSSSLLMAMTENAAAPPHAPAVIFTFSQSRHFSRMPMGSSANTFVYPADSQAQAVLLSFRPLQAVLPEYSLAAKLACFAAENSPTQPIRRRKHAKVATKRQMHLLQGGRPRFSQKTLEGEGAWSTTMLWPANKWRRPCNRWPQKMRLKRYSTKRKSRCLVRLKTTKAPEISGDSSVAIASTSSLELLAVGGERTCLGGFRLASLQQLPA
mmetsp:Transcript_96610/g.268555  ORF Transcript_96610/g.268555 Transcript_96610/m.268555 type:complete len:291 (-) Transcript_96610:35-907(-)